MSKSAAIGMAVLFVFVVGCYTHTYHIGGGAPNGPIVYQDQWVNHWLFGIISTEPDVDISKLCPSGKATIVDQHTFLNGLVAFFIGIVYSPTTITVRCAGGGKAELELSAETMARIAASDDFVDAVGEIEPDQLQNAVIAHENAKDFLKPY